MKQHSKSQKPGAVAARHQTRTRDGWVQAPAPGQANTLRASLPRSGPQFTCVEIRSGGSLVSRALLTLTISSAYLCSLTRLVHKHLLRAYCAPGPVLGCELFSARRPLPALGLQVSASCRKPSQTNFRGPPLFLLQPGPSSYHRLITRFILSASL